MSHFFDVLDAAPIQYWIAGTALYGAFLLWLGGRGHA